MSRPDDFEEPPTPTLMEEIDYYKKQISQLQSSLAELQRVYQFGLDVWNWIEERGGDVFHDEDSEQIMPMALKAGLVQRVIYDPTIHGENIEADPGDEIWWFGVPIKNLPKFVTEEEYLKLQDNHIQQGNKLIEANNELLRLKEKLRSYEMPAAEWMMEFFRLKSHAEAMASLTHTLDGFEYVPPEIEAYRKDFPK